MRIANDVMRRHFCLTLWYGADSEPLFDETDECIDLRPILSTVVDTARGLRGRYLCWSLEDSRLKRGPKDPGEPSVPEQQGGLHLHVYLECERTVRWSTVRRRWQAQFMGAHVEPKRGWRDSAREYHMGLKNGVEKDDHITHGEWGEWLPEYLGVESPEDFAADASRLIMDGGSPKEVARLYPRWFLSRGAGVVRLWETLNGRRWVR